MAEWAGVVHANAKSYFKGAADLTMRSRLFLAMLQNRGRVRLNEDGYDLTWAVEFFQPPVEDYADGGVLNYARHDTLRHANVDVRGYKVTDLMTDKERSMNTGNARIVDRYNRILPQLRKSLTDNFCSDIINIDGHATGNENRIIGLESMMGTGTNVAADRLGEPSDTYAGLSTALGNQGGSWSTDLGTSPNANAATDWPDGSGDTEYDYWSPKLVNWSSNGWGTGVQTWVGNAIKAVRQAKIWVTLTGGKEGAPDCCLLSGNLFYDFKNANDSKLRSLVPHRESDDLGFPDTMNFEGMAIKEDFDVAADTGYVLNADKAEIFSIKPELFHSRGPIYDPRVDSYLFHAGFFGNTRFQPKYFAKLNNFAS